MLWKSLLLMGVLLISGCGTSGSEQKSVLNPYKSEITGETTRDCTALEPDNPYDEGSGHYAGWEWAERVEPSNCGGNSQSFIEGCKEYQTQLEDYENCLNN